MSTHTTTFWELIKKHRIEIPIIQRDYAQGRRNRKSKEIRENFISQIKFSLDNMKGKSLHLNFVYGKIHGKVNAEKIKENKEALKGMLTAVKTYSHNLDLDITWDFTDQVNNLDENELTSFAPLDGQQRLTTLYLLHWYLMPDTEENKKLLGKFTYKIRPGSKDFCEALVQNKPDFDNLNGCDLKTFIMNASWFYDAWKYDPTVRGMLRMLNQIQQEFGKDNLDSYWKMLTVDNAVSFEFLDLESYNLTDELYVRMNARGVPLTPFENFKSWLLEHIQKENIGLNTYKNKREESRSWIELLDTTWTDLFWANKDDDNMLIDEEIMRYFRNMMQIFLVKQKSFKPETTGNKGTDPDKDKKAKDYRDKASKLATDKDKETGEYVYVPNNFYLDNKLLDKFNLDELFTSINYFSNHSYDLDIIDDILEKKGPSISRIGNQRGSIFKRFIDKDTSYRDKVLFYALSLFLKKTDECAIQLDANSLRSWMRVIRNLVENSTVDSIALFKRAIISVSHLSEYSLKIYEYLVSNNVEITGFDSYQRDEEIRKAEYIVRNPEWENIFLQFENHGYFKAQINFLLDLGEMVQKPMSSLIFEENASKMANIFNYKIKNPDSTKFERALLTEYVEETNDYLIDVNSNYSFGTLNSSKGTWHKDIFRNSNRLRAIKNLINKIEVGKENEGLEKVCLAYKDEGWRYQLVNTPKAITYCTQRLIRYNNENDIRLLGSSATNHYHAELFSFCLDQKIKKLINQKQLNISPFTMQHYYSVKSVSQKPLSWCKATIQDIEYWINLQYSASEKKYKIRFRIADSDDNQECNYSPDIISALPKGFKWDHQKRGYWVSEASDNKIIDKFKEVCNKLCNV